MTGLESRPVEALKANERAVYLSEPMPHQHDVLLDPARFKLLVCGRRWGKSVDGRLAAVEGHGPDRKWKGCLTGGQICWVMPTLPWARETFDWFTAALRDVWVGRNATEKFFLLPGGGSLWIKSSDDPDTLRGPGWDGVVLDELKDHSLKTWTVLRPGLMDKGGWFLGLGSPGLPDQANIAYYLFLRAQGRRGWKVWQEPTSRNPIVTAAEIAEAREELGPTMAARELDAQFVAPGGGLYRPEHLAHTYRLEAGKLIVGPEVFELARLRKFGTSDLAASTKTYSDFTAMGGWAEIPPTLAHPRVRLALLGVLRKKIDGSQILDAFREMIAAHKLEEMLVEGTAYHNLLIDEGIKQRLPLVRVDSHKDKVTRATPAANAAARGGLLLPESGFWLDDFKTELLCFPGEKGHPSKDDQVDMVSSAWQRALSASEAEGASLADWRQPRPSTWSATPPEREDRGESPWVQPGGWERP